MSRATIQLREDVVHVRLSGEIDEADGQAIEREVLVALGKGSKRSVWIDLEGVTGSTILGRSALASLQGSLKAQARRTVWLSNRPRWRGFALWICHMAGDPNAKVVATQDLAEAWLNEAGDRIADARAQALASVEALRQVAKRGTP